MDENGGIDMFDTLMYAKRLEAAGMTRDQAEAQINVIAEMVVDGVATKQDLALKQIATEKEFAAVRAEMHSEFAAVRSEMHEGFAAVRFEMQKEFAAVRAEMAAGFSNLRDEMLVKMGVMFAFSTTLTIGVISWVVK